MREDTNHKLALQVAENKRMQALLAKATEDLGRMMRLSENLATRVQILVSPPPRSSRASKLTLARRAPLFSSSLPTYQPLVSQQEAHTGIHS